MRLDIMHVRISLNLKSTKNNSLLAHQLPVCLPITRLDLNGSSRFCLHHPSHLHVAALAAVHHFCLLSISSISVRRQPPPRCQQTMPWRGIRASTASFVLRAKHRLRRHRHKCRAGAFVYAAPAFMHHSFLLSGHARLFILKMQKERRFDGSTKPTSRRPKLCETFL